MYKIHKDKNRHATSFKKKLQSRSSMSKNQHATNSMSEISFFEEENYRTSFTKRKINMERVSQTNIYT